MSDSLGGLPGLVKKIPATMSKRGLTDTNLTLSAALFWLVLSNAHHFGWFFHTSIEECECTYDVCNELLPSFVYYSSSIVSVIIGWLEASFLPSHSCLSLAGSKLCHAIVKTQVSSTSVQRTRLA